MDRLAVLNATGKSVWELLSEGYAQEEIASAFARHFAISHDQAMRDVGQVIADLAPAGSAEHQPGGGIAAPVATVTTDAPATDPDKLLDCGTFRFGDSRVSVRSSVAELDADYFTRFKHRATIERLGADQLEISGRHSCYRLSFRGDVTAGMQTLSDLLAGLNDLLLNLEHPDTCFCAYFHAAAVSRGGKSVLLPGTSGVGKSTLTAYLVGHGYSYLGDDLIAMAELDASLRPMPTCLSLKSGSWPILEQLYPMLPLLPTVNQHGRIVRYLEPMQIYPTMAAAVAPTVIVFSAYRADEPTWLSACSPLQTMTRLIGMHVDLAKPVSEARLAKFIGVMEQTPAYELTYADLQSAMTAIEGLLETQR